MIGDNNLDLTLNNRGTINGNGGGLTIDAAFVSNGGTLESTASGGLTIDADVSNTKTIAALANSGTLEGTGSGRVIMNAAATVTNAGTMKSTASGGLVIAVEELNNSKTIEALGDGATVRIQSGTFGVTHFRTFINNFGAGMVFASGSGAQIELDDATINNGTVKAVGSNARIVMSDSDSIMGATIAGGTVVDVVSGADVQLSGTIGSGALIEVTGSALLNLLSIANSGTVVARASGSKIFIAPGAVVRGGAIVAQGSGSEVEIFDGATVSGGTLFASGSGSLIEIVSGAVVKRRAQNRRHGGPHQRLQRQGIRVRRFGALEPEAIHRPRVGHVHWRDYLELRLRQCRQHQRNAVHLQRRHDGRCHQDGRQLFGG
jgi:hypothetical protein